MNKKELSERDICTKFITPALLDAGWDIKRQIRDLILFPPVKEQKRLVEKVDELMKLCDELELKIVKSKKEGERLIDAILQNSFRTNFLFICTLRVASPLFLMPFLWDYYRLLTSEAL